MPKRSEERAGHMTRAEKAEARARKAPGGVSRVPVPPADPGWHRLAREWYEALATSGQARFYEPSDWAFAYVLADDLSYYKARKNRSANMLAAIYAGMERLLTTEGDRRRVSLELERGGADDGDRSGVTALDEYRAALSG